MAVTAPQSRAAEFKEALHNRILVADGAMGTALYSRGVFLKRCYDELNLSLPALIRDVHQDYVRAGAEIIETNTFGANRKRLAAFGFAEKMRSINQAGVRIAREAARDLAFVAGSVGPLGVRLEPLGSTTFAEARELFREQFAALFEAGVDLLILETFRDLDELREAILAAREAAGDEVALIAQVSIEDDGSLQDGSSTETFTRALDHWPVDVIGLNCSSGPRVTLETIENMQAFTNKPLSAMPNAGLPVTVEGRNLYLCSSEYMAQYARRFLQEGVKIVGGCCGTTPEHIKEIRSEVRSVQPHHHRRFDGDFGYSRRGEPKRSPRFPCPNAVRWEPSSPPNASWRSSRSCRRAAWMPRRKLPERSCAKQRASTSSTFRTARAPAPA